ncbi:MAG: hypothetical protein H6721_22305 [Sandaracinus sp.]|nr:hypothetical protein [Sandaracinus sp.]
MRTSFRGWGPVVASLRSYVEGLVLQVDVEPTRTVLVLGGGGEWLVVALRTREAAAMAANPRNPRGRLNHPTELHGPRCHVLQGVRVVPPRTLELHFGGAGDLLLPMGDDAIAHVRRYRHVAEDRYVDLDDGRHFFAHDLTHGLELLD